MEFLRIALQTCLHRCDCVVTQSYMTPKRDGTRARECNVRRQQNTWNLSIFVFDGCRQVQPIEQPRLLCHRYQLSIPLLIPPAEIEKKACFRKTSLKDGKIQRVGFPSIEHPGGGFCWLTEFSRVFLVAKIFLSASARIVGCLSKSRIGCFGHPIHRKTRPLLKHIVISPRISSLMTSAASTTGAKLKCKLVS